MKTENDFSPLSDWILEIGDALLKSKSFYVALFSTKKRLIYSNDAFNSLVKDDPCRSFLNPSFDDLLAMDASTSLVFNGTSPSVITSQRITLSLHRFSGKKTNCW